MSAPAFVRKWCKENDVDLDDFALEAIEDEAWEKVSDELADEGKYNNERAVMRLLSSSRVASIRPRVWRMSDSISVEERGSLSWRSSFVMGLCSGPILYLL